MTNQTFKELLSGYLNDSLTKDELNQFLGLIRQGKYAEEFKEEITQVIEKESFAELADNNKADILFENILNDPANRETPTIIKEMPIKKIPNRHFFIRIIAAASVVGLILASIHFFTKNNTTQTVAKTSNKNNAIKNDVLPGGNYAVLTLANGQKIVLDNAPNGAVANQGGTTVIKLDGKLAYDSNKAKNGEVVYNTISTPPGGQYQIILPDGSTVWLNSASTLRFPTSFVGKDRRVEIIGEAYFEVAKNKNMPFIVSVQKAEIQVLGTHFDVMAYENEALLKTTLMEGSVKFVKDNHTDLLKPGQQSQLLKNGQVKVVDDVDMGDVLAWKNGIFHFNGADINTVMRQLARWYDVEIVYDKEVEELFYIDEISKNTTLSVVLKALELTGKVHFKIEGKKITVMP